MRVLDLFCGIGGASAGYARAGFTVTGVDINPQPDYPYQFVQADALTFLEDVDPSDYDFIHASPPCQGYTPLEAINHNDTNLVPPVRELILKTGLPYVIENVPNAPLHGYIIQLCGQTFRLRLYRHRWFEANWNLPPLPHAKHVKRCAPGGYLPTSEKPYMSIHGRNGHNSKAWVATAAEFMEIPWASRSINGVCEAIPPAYTAYVGSAFMRNRDQTVTSKSARLGTLGL